MVSGFLFWGFPSLRIQRFFALETPGVHVCDCEDIDAQKLPWLFELLRNFAQCLEDILGLGQQE